MSNDGRRVYTSSYFQTGTEVDEALLLGSTSLQPEDIGSSIHPFLEEATILEIAEGTETAQRAFTPYLVKQAIAQIPLNPVTGLRNVVDYFGVTGDGSPEDVQRIRDAFDSGEDLYFPGLTYTISGEPFNITGADRHIVASNATFARLSTDTESGFFRINAIRSTISGFRFVALRRSNGSATGYAIDLEDCADVFILNTLLNGVSGIVRSGHTPLLSINRVYIHNLSASWWAGHLQDPILIEHGANVSFTNVHVNADNNSPQATGVSLVAIRPRVDGFVDTITLHNTRMQCDTLAGGGIKYGLEIDATLGIATNIWCTSCNFDKSNTSGIRLVNNSSIYTYMRNVFISDVRVDDELGGAGLTVESNSTYALSKIHDCTVKGSLFRYNDGPAIKFINTGIGIVEGISVNQCTISATDTATIEAAVEIGTSGITVNGCQFTATNATVATDYAFKITEDVTDLVLLGNNVIHPDSVILHYTGGYTTPDSTRLVSVLTKVQGDTAPTLGGDLTTGGFKILGSTLYVSNPIMDRLPATTESGRFFTNSALGTITFTLPGAAEGLTFSFYVQQASTLTITARSGDTIRIGGTVTAGGGSVSSNVVGSALVLVAINTTEWVATSNVNFL